MTNKIKKLTISGIRGIKNSMELQLAGKSILLYGENGTGKSSISDSLEWFLNDEVKHLSGSEIDLKDAMRNSYINEEDDSFINIAFTKKEYDSSKYISINKNKLVSKFENNSDVLSNYLEQTKNENLIIRYETLTEFIDKTKGDKLKSLSEVIGFAEVSKIKDVLKKSYNSLRNEIKNQNYESQINTQKQILIEKIGASLGDKKFLFEKINEIISPLKIEIKVKSFEDIDIVLNKLKNSLNSIILKELQFYESCKETITLLKDEMDLLNSEYENYYKEFSNMVDDVESIIKIFLEELLVSGMKVLQRNFHSEESCPLCLQKMEKSELIKEIETRLKDIEKSSKKKEQFDQARNTILKMSEERVKRLEILKSNELYNDVKFSEIKANVEIIDKKLLDFILNGNVKVTSGKKIVNPNNLKFEEKDFLIIQIIDSKILEIRDLIKKDNITENYSKISASIDAFHRIKLFEKEKEVIENQRITMEIIYNEFVKKQKEGLENFINIFSAKINEFYQFMNPGEQFQEIRIVTIGEEDELNGITIEYKYNGNWVKPPQKYFSESHLNCFGLSFFLASVIAFNKENKFILLDDVISSFDSTHRIRFANLIFEKFSDYQIILLTHELEWFQYISQQAKRNNWFINEVKWDKHDGTHLEDKPINLKEIIELNLEKGNVEILGNPIRRYLEQILKEICTNLEVKVNFKLNSYNEKRMPDELLNELKSKIKKSSSELYNHINLLERVLNSNIMGNLLSHDNPFSPKLGDLKAFWIEVNDLEKLFYCSEDKCKSQIISVKNYDNVSKKIRCGCGIKHYDWK
ncbi:MAG: hypothetical protein WAT71_00435 [Ignavibacteria bacterium]